MVVKETMHVISPGSAKSNSSDKSGGVVPAATRISVPPNPPHPGTSKNEKLRIPRIPRSLQLQLARSLTCGVIGEDSNLYPSSQWITESRNQYDGQQQESPRTKPDFVITSLDTRKHKPQTSQLFHIRRIHKKPVCSVQASFENGKFAEEVTDPRSVYSASYRGDITESHILREERAPAEGIVPINNRAVDFDVRTEMMLPVCDSTAIPSARNPHRYLLRKRKVPPPWKNQMTNPVTHASSVAYPSLEKPRMTSYDPNMPPTGDLPFENEMGTSVQQGETERISITSLTGSQFTRKKCIPPPPGNIFVGFDSGVPPTTSHKFDDKYLPFIRARTII